VKKENQRGNISLFTINEISEQIEKLIARKREDVEKELEEKIRKEKEEAQKKIESFEKEFEEEKESITKYKALIARFEKDKEKLRNEIKEHLNKAVQLQTEIEIMTGRTLEEIKKVNELNRRLGELSHETEMREASIRKDLEGKIDSVEEMPEHAGGDEGSIDLEQDLLRLKKMKEMIKTLDMSQENESKLEEELETKDEEISSSPEVDEEHIHEIRENLLDDMEKVLNDRTLSRAIEEDQAQARKEAFKDDMEILEKYRKTESLDDGVEICYYEKDDRIILDGEFLVSTLSRHLEDVKKLYIEFSQVKSMKDQFYMEKEIKKHQEALQKILLKAVKMLRKESCSLPRYTLDILNIDVLKDILGKLIVDKWTSKESFIIFDEYAERIRKKYYARISSANGYFTSLIEELGI